MTFLYILLFLVCLSTLIMVHEAGHLITAKIFKVYCFEYALGFGPRLLSFKRKKGETRFSIRAVPFGGFVSMYGEADAVPEELGDLQIDPSRSINNIKHWKRAIIMTAGIMMNFVLALVVFFIYEIAFPAYQARVGHIIVRENSIAAQAGLKTHDFVYTSILQYGNNYYIFYDNDGTISYLDSSDASAYVGYNYAQITLKDQSISNRAVAFSRVDYGEITYSDTDYSSVTYESIRTTDYTGNTDKFSISGYIQSFKFIRENKILDLEISENYIDDASKNIVVYKEYTDDEYNKFYNFVPFSEKIEVVGNIETTIKEGTSEISNKIKILQYETSYPKVDGDNLIKQTNLSPTKASFDMDVVKKESEESILGIHHISVDIKDNNLSSDLGMFMQLDEHRNNYGQAVGNTFKDFGNSTTLIFRGLGQLFTKEGWKNVGGIIAIGVVTTQTLEQNGFGQFLFMWAMISVNLGIVNLLPFPGLDGWQFLVTIVEGVAHKEIAPKVKNTMSAIGIMLLFGLMILIVIKDIIMVV